MRIRNVVFAAAYGAEDSRQVAFTRVETQFKYRLSERKAVIADNISRRPGCSLCFTFCAPYMAFPFALPAYLISTPRLSKIKDYHCIASGFESLDYILVRNENIGELAVA